MPGKASFRMASFFCCSVVGLGGFGGGASSETVVVRLVGDGGCSSSTVAGLGADAGAPPELGVALAVLSSMLMIPDS